MREKPILFSTPMVQAILNGKKTQTRRINKDMPMDSEVFCYDFDKPSYGITAYNSDGHPIYQVEYPLKYKPGDILWVRETWSECCCNDCPYHPCGDESARIIDNGCFIYKASVAYPEEYKWKPSIFMPRQAARIFLKVESVRVERLLEISEEDARSEGMSCKSDFFKIWDFLNAKRGYSYKTNPYVWVYTFKKINQQEHRNG